VTQTLTPLERYADDFRATLGQGPGWLQQIREGAFAYFQEVGFPTARHDNEPWKYTNVDPIASREFTLAPPLVAEPAVEDLASVAPWCTVWHELVFINGRYSPSLSASPATHEPRAGLGRVVVQNLSQAMESHEGVIRKHMTSLIKPDYDGFASLNTAFLSDGAYIYAPDGEEASTHIHLLFATVPGGEPIVSHPRTLIVAGRQSKLTVIESYVSLDGSAYLNNAVTEIALEDGAHVDHYRVLLDHGAYHVGTTRVEQDRDSSFRSTSFATGPALARNDFGVRLGVAGAECRLNGLYVTAGTQHIDNLLNIDHAAPHCTSRLSYKGILDEQSRAVFGGLVLVRPGADKTDAYQSDKNLVLSDGAEVDSKPALEIYADDVICGHGATAGAVAEDALFYMRSRGIDETTANELLIRGFASDILDGVIEPLREYLGKQVVQALPRFRDGD